VGVTRRHALTLGAAAGLGTLLGPASPSSGARLLPAVGRRREPSGFGLDVAGAQLPAPGAPSPVLRAPRRFDLVGVRDAPAGLQVRTRRRGGSWSPWTPLHAHGDHAPDVVRGGEDGRPSDPVWAGGADELQLRAGRPVGGPLRMHFVAVGDAAVATPPALLARAAQVPGGRGAPPAIIPRSAWGGDRITPREAPSFGEVQVAFVHHTVTTTSYSPSQSAGIVLGIAKYHRDTNGWNDLGYNFLVDQYGQVFEGRAGGVEMPVIGAQAQGYNRLSTGIALLGTFSAVPIPEAAMRSLARLCAWKLSLHGVPTQGITVLESGGGDQNRFRYGAQVRFHRISGHRDPNATSCPGNALYAQLPELRRRAAGLAGSPARNASATIAASRRVVPYGQTVRFSGSARRASGVAAAGAPVAIQKRGASRWVTIARTRTDDVGAWAVGVTWRRTGAVRAVVAGIASPATAVTVIPRVGARVRDRRVGSGTPVLLEGSVRPAGHPIWVLIERQGPGKRWQRFGARRIASRGTGFRSDLGISRPGLYRITAGADKGQATPIVVRVVRRRR
jgi:hypothetical protein